jgi:hypothetical protein
MKIASTLLPARRATDSLAPPLDQCRPFIPNQQRLRYLRAYLDPATPCNIKAVAEAARVNRRTVYKWLDDPQFCTWFADQCNSLFRHRTHAMWQKCLDLALQSSPEHIKLIAMRTGEVREGAANGRGDGISAVFINVPRAPREPDEAIEIGSPVCCRCRRATSGIERRTAERRHQVRGVDACAPVLPLLRRAGTVASAGCFS